MFYGLTPLGVVHTLISLVAVATGFWALARDKQISPATRLGQVYVLTTVMTCVTGFGIFQHGGFGKPHVLGIVTLVALALAGWAGRPGALGTVGRYVAMLSYSITLLFHMIPAITETSTRLPLGHPLLASAEDPVLEKAAGVLFLIFIAGAIAQVRWLRKQTAAAPGAGTTTQGAKA